MERLDLVQKLAEQLVSDLFERGGTDDKQEEEVPAPFTVHQIQQVLQSAQNPSKPDPEPEEEEIAQNPSKPDPEPERGRRDCAKPIETRPQKKPFFYGSEHCSKGWWRIHAIL